MFQLPLVLALALVTAPGPRPAAGDWGASWVSVEAAARTVKQVRASFVQRKSMPILVSPLISRGAFRYRAAGAIVWEYTAPIRSRLVLKGGRAVRYLWQQGRFVVDANAGAGAMQVVLGEIKRWMRGRFRASRAFGARLRPGSPSRIVLTPLQPAITRYIRRIELTLGRRRGTIRTVTIYEQAQAVTRIQLTTTQVTYR